MQGPHDTPTRREAELTEPFCVFTWAESRAEESQTFGEVPFLFWHLGFREDFEAKDEKERQQETLCVPERCDFFPKIELANYPSDLGKGSLNLHSRGVSE